MEDGFTYGHCEEKSKPGGCQLHNLHCGYPDCDRRPTAPTPAAPTDGLVERLRNPGDLHGGWLDIIAEAATALASAEARADRAEKALEAADKLRRAIAGGAQAPARECGSAVLVRAGTQSIHGYRFDAERWLYVTAISARYVRVSPRRGAESGFWIDPDSTKEWRQENEPDTD